MFICPSNWCTLGFSHDALNHPAVAAERPRWRELAEFVAHHRLADKNFHEAFALVDQQGVTDKVRRDRAGPRPGLDRCLVAGPFLPQDFAKQLGVNERSFFTTSTHFLLIFLLIDYCSCCYTLLNALLNPTILDNEPTAGFAWPAGLFA